MSESEKPTISVIIPVYNSAAYLSQCLSSVVGQNYTALDIVVIDDGSADGSAVIRDDWAKKDSRVRVFHQRNAGLRHAEGDLIGWVDSDDTIDVDYFANLERQMREHDASHYRTDNDGLLTAHIRNLQPWIDSVVAEYDEVVEAVPRARRYASYRVMHEAGILYFAATSEGNNAERLRWYGQIALLMQTHLPRVPWFGIGGKRFREMLVCVKCLLTMRAHLAGKAEK